MGALPLFQAEIVYARVMLRLFYLFITTRYNAFGHSYVGRWIQGLLHELLFRFKTFFNLNLSVCFAR